MAGVSRNVQIVSEEFYMPPLKRSRRVWLYLPEGYEASGKRYPVMYMNDGQNLFDDSTSFSGEWGIDEMLDGVDNPCIVVGIDNGGASRMTEYNPNNHPEHGRGEGMRYLDFVVNFLKPYIDRRFRTLRASKDTIMAGSSMGGLISFYAGLYYPETFGGLGVFSPSFWIAPRVLQHILKNATPAKHRRQRYYFYAGALESATLITDVKRVAETMYACSGATINTVIAPDGRHDEPSWANAFLPYYGWMMG